MFPDLYMLFVYCVSTSLNCSWNHMDTTLTTPTSKVRTSPCTPSWFKPSFSSTSFSSSVQWWVCLYVDVLFALLYIVLWCHWSHPTEFLWYKHCHYDHYSHCYDDHRSLPLRHRIFRLFFAIHRKTWSWRSSTRWFIPSALWYPFFAVVSII